MVNDIAQTVAIEDLRLEEIVTIVGSNTHLRGALHMAKNVIIVKRRDITPNVIAPELDPSLHIISLERSSMIWSRNPMVLVNTLNLNKDSIQVIHFGNNVKGFKGNSNVLFDEPKNSDRSVHPRCLPCKGSHRCQQQTPRPSAEVSI